MTPTLRDATPADEARWRDLWAQYLAYYKTDLAPDVTDATWSRILDPASRMQCRLAETPRGVMGFAVWHHHVASWHTADDCYLEDLFVDPGARGAGAGRALISHVVEWARAAGVEKVYWLTHEGNVTARRLYDDLATLSGFVHYELDLTDSSLSA